MQKPDYESPSLEVEKFDELDIITTSSETSSSGDSSSNENMDELY